MKAMVLAAGLGTRLRPLTDERPKALVELAGKSLLERTLERLRQAGVRDAIVNVHHHAAILEEYVATHDLGMRVEISREPELLDTGGALLHAAHFFLRDGVGEGTGERSCEGSGEPFFLHNADVLSNIDLGALLAAHRASGALATLAVREGTSRRRLLFDGAMCLCGRRTAEGTDEMAGHEEAACALTFTGIHVLSPRIFKLWAEEGREPERKDDVCHPEQSEGSLSHRPRAFPIIPAYLELAARGELIEGFRCDSSYWRDLGTLQSLAEAEAELAAGLV